jgi:hypothetical protein
MGVKDTGGPAFPLDVNDSGGGRYWEGMSLRDYFAAAILPSIYTIASSMAPGDDYAPNNIARVSYRMADAMLEARKR